MSLPFTSLDGIGVAGPGDHKDLETVASDHTIYISATGSPSGFVVDLEGSHDGTNWYALVRANESALIQTVSTHFVRYVRARLISVTGGTAPAVTATIASDC